MTEKNITLDILNPVDFFGVNNANFELIRNRFPKLRITSRGHSIKAMGNESELRSFEKFIEFLLSYYSHHGVIDAEAFRDFGAGESAEGQTGEIPEGKTFDAILPGRTGLMIRPKTPNQRRLVESFQENDLIFAIGPAGTGKTYMSVALAVRALKNKEVKRIILTRPAVEAGENLGFLPGDLKDKLDPYLQPLYDALFDMIPGQRLTSFLEEGVIEIAPLAFMRGRTLDHAFVILDEAQNATIPQMKMFLTRMGKAAKFIVTGDITQVDLPRNQSSGLVHAASILKNIGGIDFIYFDNNDIVRHKLVMKIINAYNTGQDEKI